MQIKFFVWLLQRTLLTGRTDVLFRAGEEGSQVPRWRSGGGRVAAVTMEEWGCRASCWHVDGRQLEHCTRQGNRPRSKRASEGSGNNCSCRALFWTVRSRSHGGEYETTWPNEWRELMELISLCRDTSTCKEMDGPRKRKNRGFKLSPPTDCSQKSPYSLDSAGSRKGPWRPTGNSSPIPAVDLYKIQSVKCAHKTRSIFVVLTLKFHCELIIDQLVRSLVVEPIHPSSSSRLDMGAHTFLDLF